MSRWSGIILAHSRPSWEPVVMRYPSVRMTFWPFSIILAVVAKIVIAILCRLPAAAPLCPASRCRAWDRLATLQAPFVGQTPPPPGEPPRRGAGFGPGLPHYGPFSGAKRRRTLVGLTGVGRRLAHETGL